MSKLPLIDDPAHWRQRAEEARRMTDQIVEADAKKTMQAIAEAYEQLATLAEAKLSK